MKPRMVTFSSPFSKGQINTTIHLSSVFNVVVASQSMFLVKKMENSQSCLEVVLKEDSLLTFPKKFG